MAARSLALVRRPARARLDLRTLAVLVGALAVAVVVPTVIVRQPALGIALLIALGCVPVALTQPAAALAGWVVLLFFSRVPGVGSFVDRILLLIAVCWVGLLIGRRCDAKQALAGNALMLALVAVFFTWLLLSMVWAPVPADAERELRNEAYGILGFAMVLGLVIERRHARWIALGYVVGATISVLYGAALGGLTGGGTGNVSDLDGRFQAGSGDPNYLAAVLLPGIVIAGALAVGRRTGERLVLFLSILVMAIGLAATQSRGGLIASGVIAVVAFLAWPGKRALVATLATLAAGATAAFFLIFPQAWERIGSGNSTGSGRVDIWAVAWQVVRDHPIIGVGINQFPQVSPHYVFDAGPLEYVDLIIDKGIVVHNLYLQLWVDAGIVGLAMFLAVCGTSIAISWSAARRFVALGDVAMESLARSVALGVIATLTAAFFLSNLSNHQMWILLALGPALLFVARREGAQQAGDEP